MTQQVPELGNLLELTFNDGLYAYPALDEYDKIEAIWQNYVSTGKLSDRLVTVVGQAGSEFTFLISNLGFMDKTTRDSRRRLRERTLAFKREKLEDGELDG
jgi:hypothetical protein